MSIWPLRWSIVWAAQAKRRRRHRLSKKKNNVQKIGPNLSNKYFSTPCDKCVLVRIRFAPKIWLLIFRCRIKNGKNFESITQYFNVRQKRYKLDNGVSVQKSKEQIRHFYYRTWHKVLKYISMPSLKADSSSSTAAVNTTVTITFDSSLFSLRDMQVKCLIAFNLLMTKLHREIFYFSSLFDDVDLMGFI